MLTLEEIIAACGHIVSTDALGRHRTGTGYLIAPNLVATCEHVVRGADLSNIEVNFDGTKKLAKGVRTNANSDCAIIELDDRLVEAVPLVLGGTCSWKATWDSYGFPAAGKGAGVTMSGIVSNPNARDDLQAAVLELTSPEVAAGMASPLHGFSGSPVVVDGVVVGHLKRFLSDPEEPTRPAYGKVYATRAACVSSLLIGTALPEPLSVEPPLPDSPGYQVHLHNVRTLLDRWAKTDMPPGRAGLVAAESLIQLGESEEAIKVLGTVPPTVKKDQLFALALAKTWEPDNIEKAVRILERLQASGHLDAETGGLLGGRFKQIWKQSGKKVHLERSNQSYLAAFAATGDSYPGINAAATALWLGDKLESKRIATAVLEIVDAKWLGSMDHWDLATKAEALMLTGDIDQAREWYKKAALRCDYAPESIRTMHEQAAQNIDSMGVDKNVFADVFR